ncbi:MAG: heavy-metal-associated domain-containing protein [Bdellovibrionales bacterium]|nr:heavy-metal-associated domain-containing protein [Bdellovibrionales bacterium]
MRYILFALSLSLTSAAFASEVKVGVKGMVCAFCAQGIEKKFKAQEEVDSINVSLENKFITIKYKDGKTLPQEKITQLLKDSGYEAVFEK